MAVRGDGDRLAWAAIMTDPLPDPDDWLNSNQGAVDVTAQVALDDTVTEVVAEYHDGRLHDARFRVNDGPPTVPAPGCVTVTVRVTWGEPKVVTNVTVAVRDDADVFVWADKVTDPFPKPEAGDTVSQAASDDTPQVVFEDNTTSVEAVEADGRLHDDIPSVNSGDTAVPGWLTATVCDTWGEPLVVVNVTVALRDEAAAFA